MSRKCTACVTVLALLSAPLFVHAQQYPTKPIRMLVGFTPGSEIDVIGRLVAPELSERLGQRVVVDNRSGAGGTVAGAIVAVATPDGYTLFLNSVGHAASAALYPKLPYSPSRDFIPVSQVTSAPNVLIVSPNQNLKSIKELIATVKQKPGQLNFGHAGPGSGTHISGEMFKSAAQLDVISTAYKGSPELVTDTLAGRILYSFSPIGSTIGLLKDKRLVPLAVTTLARNPLFPDVPTVAETVIPGFEWDQWYGLFAPANTPRAIVEKLSKELGQVLALPDIKEKVGIRGSVTKASTPEQFGKFFRAEEAKIGKAIRDAGIKLN
jgi:tripartite-type tricarboxylate transporter receptor subunit TctC